jgi:hypothetical protein
MAGRRRRSVVVSLVAVAAASCLWTTAASAATVTVGSPLTADFSSNVACGGACTMANVALGESGAHLSSPVSGTIIRWRVITAGSEGTGTYALRVLRPSGGEFIGAGTSAGNVTSPGPQTFTASLPIQAGDLIGVDSPGSPDNVAAALGTGSKAHTWFPPVPDGGMSGTGTDAPLNPELALNADVQFPDAPASPAATPTSSKKKCKKKHKRSAQSAKKKCKKKKKR